MTPKAILQWIVVLLTAVAIGWGVVALRSGAVKELKLAETTAVVKAQVKAAEQTAILQSKVDNANIALREREAERAAVRDRLALAEQRLRDATPSTRDYAAASAEALRDYAASLDRDFADCRGVVRQLADESAAASDAAHALNDSWPELANWKSQSAAFAAQALKGITP